MCFIVQLSHSVVHFCGRHMLLVFRQYSITVTGIELVKTWLEMRRVQKCHDLFSLEFREDLLLA
jgi:hypothetical protein